MIIAAKCAPKRELLELVCQSGLKAVEIYLEESYLKDVDGLIKLCKEFPLRYALHAPGSGKAIEQTVDFSKGINAEIVVLHNCYWEDEWEKIIKLFKQSPALPCVENTYSIHEPSKYMRRYNIGRCLDLEHMQFETLGVFEAAFLAMMREASHIHLTGYRCNTNLWHTPVHYSSEHNRYLLGLLKMADYKGLIVSEAETVYQTMEEFKKLKEFFDCWETEPRGKGTPC